MDANELETPSNRNFGVTFLAAFAIFGALPLLAHAAPHWWAWLVAVFFGGIAWVRPHWLAPFNRLWARFGLLLHGIVSPIALAVLFYGVVTPTGMAMRLLGKDLLRLSFDRSAASYWIERTPPGPVAETLRNQF